MDYDDSDNRTFLQNGKVTTTFSFDAVSRLEWRKDTSVGQPERQTTFTYSDWDDLETLTYTPGNSRSPIENGIRTVLERYAKKD